MTPEQNKNDNQLRCNCIKEDIKENTLLLAEQIKLRNSFMRDGKTADNSNYTNTLTAIRQLQEEILKYESESRALGCNNIENPQTFYDNRTIVATSSVCRKDPGVLIKLDLNATPNTKS